MNSLILVILLPIAATLLGFLFYRLRNEFSFIGIVLTLYIALRIFLNTRTRTLSFQLFNISGNTFSLYADAFSGLILLAIAFFGLCLVLYSFRYIRGIIPDYQRLYYFYIMATVAGANGAVLSKNLFLLLIFLGFLVLTFYGILLLAKNDSGPIAKKALTFALFSYLLMVIGTGLLFFKAGPPEIVAVNRIPLTTTLPLITFFLLAIGALAKVGSMPFHTWIPEASTTVPASTMAFIPVAINNLLGIYLLVRIAFFLFDLTSNLVVMNILMAIGALTILVAVITAMFQKNLLRRMSYYTISQVGYMVLGIGTATLFGIAGAIFHMINLAIYKTALYLSAGSVEFRTKTQEINQLGGLSSKMPLTFSAFLVTALALSGIPLLNGFFSQWLIYQGVLSGINNGNYLSLVFLISAILGSILTLASFLKLTHNIFFGSRPKSLDRTIEVGFSMYSMPLILALFCILFGVFAKSFPLTIFILPSLKPIFSFIPTIEFWQQPVVTILMVSWVGLGILIYLLNTVLGTKTKRAFVGGEKLNSQDEKNNLTHSYAWAKDLPVLATIFEYILSNPRKIYQFLSANLRIFSSVIQKIINHFFKSLSSYLLKKQGLKKIRNER